MLLLLITYSLSVVMLPFVVK